MELALYVEIFSLMCLFLFLLSCFMESKDSNISNEYILK